MADVSYEEELHIEVVLRSIVNYIDPDEVPDLISAFAKENYRLVKIIQQAGDHIDKINAKSSSKNAQSLAHIPPLAFPSGKPRLHSALLHDDVCNLYKEDDLYSYI